MQRNSNNTLLSFNLLLDGSLNWVRNSHSVLKLLRNTTIRIADPENFELLIAIGARIPLLPTNQPRIKLSQRDNFNLQQFQI